MQKKYKLKPIWYLIIGIIFLVVPTAVYLGFLIPSMKEEYIILMSSGGVLGGVGMLGTSMIPEQTKFGIIYKTASKSFTLLVVVTLVQEFIMQIIGLVAVFILSYIVFLIFKEVWKNARRAKENAELAEEVARSINDIAK